MDATHGFKRAHNGRADITAQLATYRKGHLYAPLFDTRTVVIESPQGPRHVNHAGIYRAYVSALNLCAEMQNALRIDLSLADQVVHPQRTSPISPYVWARQAETHHRFLATYVSVLAADTLPNLDAITKALYGQTLEEVDDGTPSPAFLASTPLVEPVDPSELFRRNLLAAQALVTHASEATSHAGDLQRRLEQLATLDRELLAELKQLLRRAVNAVAYRESATAGSSVHPTIALNVMCRKSVDEYQRAIAELL
jgi:hypothetical protein